MSGKLKLTVLVPAIAALLAIVALTLAVGPPDGPALAQAPVPEAPTGLVATSVAHNSVTLGWDDPQDDSITGYLILRRDVVNQPPGTFTTVEDDTANSATTYVDSTVVPETRYAYRIKAINASGVSEQSNYVNVETPDTPAPPGAPAAPTGLTATSVSFFQVILSWDDPADDSITGYKILRRNSVTDQPGSFTAIQPDTGSAATAYIDDSARPGQHYVYRVKAINPQGESEESGYVNADTPGVPLTPAGLTASSVSHDSVALSWDDPDDDSITGYQVLRRSRDGDDYGDGQGAPEFVAVVDDTGSSATAYTDTSVAARTRYVYRIRAINPAGPGERSTYLNVETAAAPVVTVRIVSAPVPAKPTGLAASTVSDSYVSFGWNDPKDNSITHYKVLRREGDSGKFTAVEKSTGSADTSYTDVTVSAGTAYEYRVVAVNGSGDSPESDSLAVMTLAVAAIAARQQQSETETIWEATMTVGRSTETGRSGDDTVDVEHLGYYNHPDPAQISSSFIPNQNQGSLDDNEFEFLGTTYVVNYLSLRTTRFRGNVRNVRLMFGGSGFAHLLAIGGDDMVLHIGDQSFSLSGFDGLRLFEDVLIETAEDLSLSQGDTVDVRLEAIITGYSPRTPTVDVTDPVIGTYRQQVYSDGLQGEDGIPVSDRLAVGEEWAKFTYPTSCRFPGTVGRLTPTTNPVLACVRDVESQWFVVRLEADKKYNIEIQTSDSRLRPRLYHISPSWATGHRYFHPTGDIDCQTFTGTDGEEKRVCLPHADGIWLRTYGGSRLLHAGDYFIRVGPGPIGIRDPRFEIRVYESD